MIKNGKSTPNLSKADEIEKSSGTRNLSRNRETTEKVITKARKYENAKN
jgi:hypothetical protein